MLPVNVTRYMPHVGLLVLVLGLVLGIISAVDTSSNDSSPAKQIQALKFQTLSNVLSLFGGFLLVAGSVQRSLTIL